MSIIPDATVPSGALPVFDIGGTWFRSGICTAQNRVVSRRRSPAANYRRHPVDAPTLQRMLVDYLVDEHARLRPMLNDDSAATAGISMGAAMNAHTGHILNSGPLWGPDSPGFDLTGALSERNPGVDWVVVNDITASLLHQVSLTAHGRRRLTLVTVSTGIGCRTYDFRSGAIPVDPDHGLQGEIGHLPVTFAYQGQMLTLQCDCGGQDHLNAFSSGRGIEALIDKLSVTHPAEFNSSKIAGLGWKAPGDGQFTYFADALLAGDAFAGSVLAAATRPVADVLRTMFTLDPEVERVVLTGGVINTLREAYRQALLSELNRFGLYQVTSSDPRYFDSRIELARDSDDAGLIGAALAARRVRATKARAERSAALASPGPAAHVEAIRRVGADRHFAYAVIESDSLFERGDRRLLETGQVDDAAAPRRLVLIDAEVDRFHGPAVRDYFTRNGVDHRIVTIDSSDSGKSPELVGRLLAEFQSFGVRRLNEPVIAIGGGSLLDAAGLAASLFRRGVPYVRVPTTLLGLVDAGIGSKVGVDFAGHKNRLGAYYVPRAVFLDRSFLSTLDPRQLRSGMAEIVKIALVRDGELFDLMERDGATLVRDRFQGSGASIEIVRRAVRTMLDELEPNLWEQRLERAADFGHSFSPIIEMEASPKLLHGEAVALDMALSVVIAASRGLLPDAARERVFVLLSDLRLPAYHPVFETVGLQRCLDDVAAHRGGRQRVPLPTAIGAATFVDDISASEVTEAVTVLKASVGNGL